MLSVDFEIYAEPRSLVPGIRISAEICAEVESLTFVDSYWVEAEVCLDFIVFFIDPEVVLDHLRSHELIIFHFLLLVSVPDIVDVLLELIDLILRVLLVGIELCDLVSHVVHLGENGFGPEVLGVLHFLLCI